MSNKPEPEEEEKERSRSPIKRDLDNLGFGESKSKLEWNLHLNLHQPLQQIPDFQFKNRPHYENTKNHRAQEEKQRTWEKKDLQTRDTATLQTL